MHGGGVAQVADSEVLDVFLSDDARSGVRDDTVDLIGADASILTGFFCPFELKGEVALSGPPNILCLVGSEYCARLSQLFHFGTSSRATARRYPATWRSMHAPEVAHLAARHIVGIGKAAVVSLKALAFSPNRFHVGAAAQHHHRDGMRRPD